MSRLRTMNYTGTLITEECCECHITFAMPKDLQRRCSEDPAIWFFCPLGHMQHYATSEVQRLKERLEREQSWRKNAETRERAAQDQADAAERSARAYKGHLTRTRKRIGNGVCPCCNRHFTNVERHMRGQHPDYREAAPDGAA